MLFSKQIEKALIVAAKAHQKQFRKSTDIPYITHPVAVFLIAEQYTDDENTLIACLLHDVLEDVPPAIYSESDMVQDFGDEVVKIVKDVSEDKTAGEPEKPWRERKEGYLTHLENSKDSRSLLVSVADKIHNLASMVNDYEEVGDKLWERFNASKEDELWYYSEIERIIDGHSDIPIKAKDDFKEIFGKLKIAR